MSALTTQVLDTYYETIGNGIDSFSEARLRELLAPELVFEGPIAGRRVGAEGFIKGVAGFVASAQAIVFLQRVSGGDHAAALYDARLPGGTVRFAEFFVLAAGRIQTLQLLFNGAEYRDRGGR